MSISFEESKRQLAETPMMMSMARSITLDAWERSEKYSWFEEYYDDKISTIDEDKNIAVHKSQINISQESNSQFIPFEMMRRYDNIDLMEMNISIHYTTSDNYHGVSDPVNVEYNADKIRFTWRIDENVTHIKGALKFEVHADGVIVDNKNNSYAYRWKSKPTNAFSISESLCNDDCVDIDPSDDWVVDLVDSVVASITDKIVDAEIGQQVEDANNAADRAEAAANVVNATISNALNDYSTTESIKSLIGDLGDSSNVVSYIDTAVENVDVTDELNSYALKTDIENFVTDDELTSLLEGLATEEYVNTALDNINLDGYVTDSELTDKLDGYALSTEIPNIEGLATEQYVDNAIEAVDVSDKLSDYAKKSDIPSVDGFASKTYVDDSFYKKTETYNKSEIDAKTNHEVIQGDISNINNKIDEINQNITNLESSSRVSYEATYGEVELQDGTVVDNMFTLWRVQGADGESTTKTKQSQFKIVGGSGGGESASKPKVEYVTPSPYVISENDKAIIYYNFSDTDSSGDGVPEATATWYVGKTADAMRKVHSETIYVGENLFFDATNYLFTGKQLVKVEITDPLGGYTTKMWSVKKVRIDLDVKFDDTKTHPIGNSVDVTYVAYGDIAEKYVHFVLDGRELDVVQVTTSGDSKVKTIQAQSHGAHLLKVYMTAKIDNNDINVDPIYRDIIWYDENSDIPVISTRYQEFTAKQYDTTEIEYAVYDPSTGSPSVEIAVDGRVVSSQNLTKNINTYSFKTDIVGEHIITITCGETVKTLKATIEDLGINISPVVEGYVFDFNPVGKSNKDENDINWTSGSTTLSVSDNFDWNNGGYQTDENGDQYFCVKAGTTATINYPLFGNDAKINGKEFKVIFKTTNIKKRDTSFLSCINDGIGIDMNVENAYIYGSDCNLHSPYCEDDVIEFDFNIYPYDVNKSIEENVSLDNMNIVLTFEDGVPNTPMKYTATQSISTSFWQTSPQPIKIGSEYCDTHIYRMRVYEKSLSNVDILNNFIIDARNSEEMINRHIRNKIYDDSGNLVSTSASGDFSADALMKAAPDLRYIFLEVPHFTNDKDNKIDNCNVYFRYPAGTRPQDNWDCTSMRHRGQGTSSNDYGYSGRNIDLCMDRSTSLFTWRGTDGSEVNSRTITLTDTSVPTDYLNIKVNIASSENTNNAQLARRFNEYQPFLRYARKKDSKVKDTMEFYNCVVFIRETSEDLQHREFNDDKWHFYGIGNVGDSKKTDDTRVNDKNDPLEHIVEITDVDKPLSGFPTGQNGNVICPVSDWCAGNTVYDILYSTDYVYDEEGEFESFGGKTYEFRYEMDGITPEQRETNINTWRNLYKFIVTSTDAEFYANLKNYFVVDSALYYYLFTERYTMVDNRAKNSFWHYGKVYISTSEASELGEDEVSYYIVDNEAAAINNGYRYDLTFGYDFDTALGIDNTGDFVFSYGKEDTDYCIDGDESSEYVFRVADSVFFCRLRDLFPTEMQAMFKNREEKNAWNSKSLIDQWDNAQAQFPEELWILDYERKYYRTYTGLSIDNSITNGRAETFLIGKFFGRKKYSRRAFEINQEVYFATKYFGNKILEDRFYIRGGVGKNPNYSITLVPYTDMYLCMQYTSTGTPIHSEENGRPKRIKAGQSYTFENNAESMDFIYVYAASYIQEVGDLSRCYVGDNDFSRATRLQKLVIGSAANGYDNTNMKVVLVANNPLLEHLDLRNISGINTAIDVSGCKSLKELYAEGTNATSVAFSDGCDIEIIHLPKVNSLSMKNLRNIREFTMEKVEDDNGEHYVLKTLVVENTPIINTYDLVSSSPDLSVLRLIGMNWDRSYNIQNSSILDRALKMRGIDNNGIETPPPSTLTGDFYVSEVRDKSLEVYNSAWPDLEIGYNIKILQYYVTFKNSDGEILEIQCIDEGKFAIDPTKRVENKLIPTIESTISHNFEFASWRESFADADFNFETTKIFEDRTLIATYSESLREYTVKYVFNGNVLHEATGLYGDYIEYEGALPTYTADEENGNTYYLFKKWNKSGYIDEDKVIEPEFDSLKYNNNTYTDKELSDLTNVEIYALSKLGIDNTTMQIEDGDPYSIQVGYDIDYKDIASELIIDNKVCVIDDEKHGTQNNGKSAVFTGSNYIDTNIKLFEEDRDFVLAIDYKYLDGNKTNSVLAQCFKSMDSCGFQIGFNNSTTMKFVWGNKSTTTSLAQENNREMIVLRHKSGDDTIYVYTSNLSGEEVAYQNLISDKNTLIDSTLVLGGMKADDGYVGGHSVGNIYWCKVWYKDLGDSVCRKLANWTHEKIDFQMCGRRRFYLADNSGNKCMFSLLATHLLDCTMRYGVNGTYFEWSKSILCNMLNNRLYMSIPDQTRLLIREVNVTSGCRNAENNNDVVTLPFYITIPAVIELDRYYQSFPLTEEIASDPMFESKTISYMVRSSDRIRQNKDGTWDTYWTRSIYPSSYTTAYYVSSLGSIQSSPVNRAHGVLIQISF